jgi:hypothetical protein
VLPHYPDQNVFDFSCTFVFVFVSTGQQCPQGRDVYLEFLAELTGRSGVGHSEVVDVKINCCVDESGKIDDGGSSTSSNASPMPMTHSQIIDDMFTNKKHVINSMIKQRFRTALRPNSERMDGLFCRNVMTKI